MSHRLQTVLNRLTPGSNRAKLGDVIYALITGTNLQATQWNAFLAHLDAANVTGIGNANVATFGVNTVILTPDQRQ